MAYFGAMIKALNPPPDISEVRGDVDALLNDSIATLESGAESFCYPVRGLDATALRNSGYTKSKTPPSSAANHALEVPVVPRAAVLSTSYQNKTKD